MSTCHCALTVKTCFVLQHRLLFLQIRHHIFLRKYNNSPIPISIHNTDKHNHTTHTHVNYCQEWNLKMKSNELRFLQRTRRQHLRITNWNQNALEHWWKVWSIVDAPINVVLRTTTHKVYSQTARTWQRIGYVVFLTAIPNYVKTDCHQIKTIFF